MNFAQEMSNLCEGIAGSFDARVKFLGQNAFETHKTLDEARKFIAKCSRDHKAMGRKLRADLGGFVEDLSDTVGSLRKRFKAQQGKVHQEFRAGHHAFAQASKTMAAKRRNFHASFKKAEQSASRAHH